MIDVVGIGADGWDGLSARAHAAVVGADVIFGSARQLNLVPTGHAVKITWPSPLLPALAELFDRHADSRRCVLASGDPMFFGIGSTLAGMLGADQLRVFPQPSSASLACARLGWALDSVPVISAVGRPVAALARHLAPGRRLLVLSADADTPFAVKDLLDKRGYAQSRVWVLQELGSADERIHHATAAVLTGQFAALNIVAVECSDGPAQASFGLPDLTYAHDGQLTKRDLRAVTIARLAPSYGQLLWDVGAGSGSIGIEWLRSAPSGRAVAIERDPVRAERASDNAIALGVPGLVVVCAAAPAAFAGLDAPDAVFIGGGLTVPGVLDAAWAAVRPGGRLVANAVTLESEALLLRWFGDVGGELTRIGISHAEPIGGFTGWRPAMPITQWTSVKP